MREALAQVANGVQGGYGALMDRVRAAQAEAVERARKGRRRVAHAEAAARRQAAANQQTTPPRTQHASAPTRPSQPARNNALAVGGHLLCLIPC